jgi:hypothetical protein
MQQRGILAELEAFDIGMINYAKYLIHKGLLEGPHYFNLLLGNIACAQADPLHLGVMLRDLPENSLWSVAGIGDAQLPMNSMGVACGGACAGLEDNIWYDGQRSRLAVTPTWSGGCMRWPRPNERHVMAPPLRGSTCSRAPVSTEGPGSTDGASA